MLRKSSLAGELFFVATPAAKQKAPATPIASSTDTCRATGANAPVMVAITEEGERVSGSGQSDRYSGLIPPAFLNSAIVGASAEKVQSAVRFFKVRLFFYRHT